MSDKDMKNMDMKHHDNQKMSGMKMNHKNMKMDNHNMKHMDHMDMNSKSGHDSMKMNGMNMDHHSMNMDHGSMDMDHMDMGNGGMMMHGGHMMNMGNLKQKFWVSLIVMIPIILMSPMMGMKLPFTIQFPGSDWVVAILGSFMYFYGGKPFFSGAKGEMESHKPAMMSLITLGITVAYAYSIYATIANDIFHVTPMVNNFFWELATLIVIMLLGHWIEMNSIMNAGSALNALAKLLPDSAHLVTSNGDTKDVSVSDLTQGNYVLVEPGEKIPADGDIKKGQTLVNESLVTGESKKQSKKVNDKVIGGSINDNGTITVQVTGTGKSGYLSKVMNMVSQAQSSKSKDENMADRISGYLFYAALAIAIIATIIWIPINGFPFAISIAVSTLVIACPHALGLAVPLVVSRSTSIAARNGLLIRNRNALEHVKNIKYALMDKTGTLTQGNFKVNHFESLDQNYSNEQVLQIIGSLEQGSSHPLAEGVLNLVHSKKINLSSVKDEQQVTGAGIAGTIDNQRYALLASSYLNQHQIAYNHDLFDQLSSRGNSVSFLLQDDHVIGILAEGDQIKANSKEMVQYLKAHHIIPVMLTGDNQKTAASVAHQLGIDKYEAELLPEDKQKMVSRYQNDGKVIFIGDGVNDAPSLAKANIGIAIGSGTDVAIDSADIVLVNSDPKDVISMLQLATKTNHKMVENLWWGAGYNIIALPLAAGVLAFIGIVLDPMVGAIIMSLSTVIVALNAMTLTIKK
ncbi:heavy metal translocating P-type ATPase [Philodulcilactobacillus myokoensis]|nr:copper-translocating P-type ATPase [Philodulcilactobacillus myokoensis]